MVNNVIAVGSRVVPTGAGPQCYSGKVVRIRGDHADVCWRGTRDSTAQNVPLATLEARPHAPRMF